MNKDYKKLYEETIDKLRKLYNDWNSTQNRAAKEIELVLPELHESEDERIRKELIEFVKSRGGFKHEYLAWLEKQGEQKPSDKVEPKFKIEKGKWYVCIRNLYDNYANKAFSEGDTYLSTQDGSLIPSNSNVPFEVVCPDTYFRDWTIQDAKDGDVLCSGNPFIFSGFGDKRHPNNPTAYCGIDSTDKFILSDRKSWWTAYKVNPATKEQCEQLEKAMANAGWEFDFEKKELNKIEQKPAWSEEDEEKLNSIIEVLGEDSLLVDWLNSIKDRVQPQPEYEWSKEDKEILDGIIDTLDSLCLIDSDRLNWLKSLKPNHWNPSEFQLECLKKVIPHNNTEKDCELEDVLTELYNDLKNL